MAVQSIRYRFDSIIVVTSFLYSVYGVGGKGERMRKPTYNQDHDIRWRMRTATGWIKRKLSGRRWRHRQLCRSLLMSKVDGEE
nr:MAG TPA: hypothetical protein [Caudovirales sp. ct8Ze27]